MAMSKVKVAINYSTSINNCLNHVLVHRQPNWEQSQLERPKNITYIYKYLPPQNNVLGSAEYDINSGGVEVS